MTIPSCTGPINVIKGTLENDTLIITKASGADGLRGMYEVNFNGRTRLMSEEELCRTEFDLRDGNDFLFVAPDVTARITAFGGKGDDVLMGGGGDDHLYGDEGSDRIFGGGGSDVLKGGMDRDRDFLDGGPGKDVLIVRTGDKVGGWKEGDNMKPNADMLLDEDEMGQIGPDDH